MTATTVEAPDWSSIPAPPGDGAATHLLGARLPYVPLPATDGSSIDLSALPGRTILYAYPRTGQPGADNPAGWDMLPGARGCSPQSCEFRDHFAELRHLGVDQVSGLSTQDNACKQEVAGHLRLPFPLLSDGAGALTQALDLPTFVAARMTLSRQFTLVIDSGTMTHLFHPGSPPDQNAADIVTWFSQDGGR